jgi:hypothetical protein
VDQSDTCFRGYTAGNSHSSVHAKTHRKMRIPSEKYFSNGERSENTHRNMMSEKLIFSVCSPSEKYFSVRSTLTEKCDSPD